MVAATMAKLTPPEALDFTQPQKWTEWARRFQRYRTASKLDKEDGEVQVSTFIYAMGPEAEIILDKSGLEEADRSKFDKVFEKFESHFTPQRNYIHEHAIFNRRSQLEGESVEQYVRTLYDLASRCDFMTQKENNIRDRLVIGLRDTQLSQELQLKRDLTLEIAIETARQSEQVKQQVTEQAKGQAKNLDAIKKGQGRGASKPWKWQQTTDQANSRQKCGRCNRFHPVNKCPAHGKACKKCNKIGHFAVCCRTSVRPSHKFKKSAHEVSTDSLSDSFFLGNVSTGKEQWKVDLPILGRKINFKIDCGADVTILKKSVFEQIEPRHKPKLKVCNQSLITAGGTEIACDGYFKAKTKYNGRHYKEDIYVANSTSNLLSRKLCSEMGIISLNINECQNENDLPKDLPKDTPEDIFDGIGCVQGDPVKIKLKEDAKPFHVNAPRRIALPLVEKVQQEVNRMEREGVIQKVTEPTDWCAPMAVVLKKTGAVRICVDLRGLNKAVKRERYVLPTVEDVAPKLRGCTVFSTLDAASGYYQLPLEENSSKFTTFMTPFGRYMFRRLPMGITSASEIFQRRMTQILEGLDGVAVYQDDIIVAGATKEEHDNRMNEVFRKLKKAGLKLNKNKCTFSKSELNYLGHSFSSKGISPSPDKIEAITKMVSPTNVTELRRFLGMINYLGRYIPNISEVVHPLNELLKHDIQWNWGKPHEDAFIKVKKMITSAPTLTFFDPSKPITVTADASSYGLGAALLQSENGEVRPVAFVSRTLLPSECRYAQIEKECLALVWACEKFHRYLYGLPEFKMITDHKPLVPLLNSHDLSKAPLRCQRLLMRMMRYNGTAEYAPGKTLTIADALSRSPLKNKESGGVTEIDEIYLLEDITRESWAISDSKLEELEQATAADLEMCEVIQFTLDGWPKYCQDVPENLKQWYEHRGHLSVARGLLLYQNRIVIPQSRRAEILTKIHLGHQGINKSKARAESCVWWIGINRDIKETVEQCKHCSIHRNSQRREPLISTNMPNYPWEHIAADLFVLKGENYLVVVDYYSRYPEIVHLIDTTSQGVICKIKSIFARWGIPSQLTTDNGPQFSSNEFKKFAKEYEFIHQTSSPRYPQANGEAERFVNIAKKICIQEDPFMALMVYRNTPNTSTGVSPAMLMIGRNLRTTLPTLEGNVRVNHNKIHNKARKKDEESKKAYEYFYNRRHSTRSLTDIVPGQMVRIKDDTGNQKTWSQEGQIIEKCNTPRSYIVKLPEGKNVRRNRRHILEKFQEDPDPGVEISQEDPVVKISSEQTPKHSEQAMESLRPTQKSSGEQVHTSTSSDQGAYRTDSGRLVKAPKRLEF